MPAPCDERYRRIYETVTAIPPGRVAPHYFRAGTEALDALLWGPGMLPAKHSR